MSEDPAAVSRPDGLRWALLPGWPLTRGKSRVQATPAGLLGTRQVSGSQGVRKDLGDSASALVGARQWAWQAISWGIFKWTGDFIFVF